MLTTMIQYDTFRLRTVAYRENLPINLLYIQDLNGDFIPRLIMQYDTESFRLKIYGKKLKDFVGKEDQNVDYFPFQGAITTAFSFFKTVYHMMQTIQFRSTSVLFRIQTTKFFVISFQAVANQHYHCNDCTDGCCQIIFSKRSTDTGGE